MWAEMLALTSLYTTQKQLISWTQLKVVGLANIVYCSTYKIYQAIYLLVNKQNWFDLFLQVMFRKNNDSVAVLTLFSIFAVGDDLIKDCLSVLYNCCICVGIFMTVSLGYERNL